MKGAHIFWISILIAGAIKGLFIAYNSDRLMFTILMVVVLYLYEYAAALKREGENWKDVSFGWRHISILWLVYVAVKYYINPFLNKILK